MSPFGFLVRSTSNRLTWRGRGFSSAASQPASRGRSRCLTSHVFHLYTKLMVKLVRWLMVRTSTEKPTEIIADVFWDVWNSKRSLYLNDHVTAGKWYWQEVTLNIFVRVSRQHKLDLTKTHCRKSKPHDGIVAIIEDISFILYFQREKPFNKGWKTGKENAD